MPFSFNSVNEIGSIYDSAVTGASVAVSFQRAKKASPCWLVRATPPYQPCFLTSRLPWRRPKSTEVIISKSHSKSNSYEPSKRKASNSALV